MSKTEKYQSFFTKLIQDLEEIRPGLTEYNVQKRKSWVKICKTGQPSFYVSSSFSRDGFRINLTLQAKNENENKALFDALEKQRSEIENAMGVSLDWRRDHGPGVKRSDICAVIPGGQITDSDSKLRDYRNWAVKTTVTFVDTFRPRVEQHLYSKS